MLLLHLFCKCKTDIKMFSHEMNCYFMVMTTGIHKSEIKFNIYDILIFLTLLFCTQSSIGYYIEIMWQFGQALPNITKHSTHIPVPEVCCPVNLAQSYQQDARPAVKMHSLCPRKAHHTPRKACSLFRNPDVEWPWSFHLEGWAGKVWGNASSRNPQNR